MIKTKGNIKKEIEDTKIVISETKQKLKEIKDGKNSEVQAHKEMLENKSQASWDKLSDKGLKGFNIFQKSVGVVALLVSLAVIFIAGDTSPIAIIILLYSIYLTFIFDARKMTSAYKNEKKIKNSK